MVSLQNVSIIGKSLSSKLSFKGNSLIEIQNCSLQDFILEKDSQNTAFLEIGFGDEVEIKEMKLINMT